MRGVREDGRGHGPDLVVGQGTFRTQHRGTGSEAGCELHDLSPDKEKRVCCSPHRIPRFGAQPFGCLVRSARGTRLALLPPSFLSSSPATVRSARTGPSGGKRGVGAARRRSRGHGPARLDGTRPRATVADKVMKSGETAGHGNGPSTRRPHGKRSAQARSWKPGRRRQPSGARERWKPVRGETPQAARCATRTRARPAMFLGRGRPDFKARCTSSCASHRETGSTATAVVWPIRRSRFGGL